MKKAIIPAALVCLIFLTAAWTQAANTENELTEMAALADSLDMDVSEWRLTLKESVSQDKIYSIIESIGQYAKVSKTTEDQAERYFAEKVHKSDGTSESFIVIVPKVGDAQLIIELKGEKWDGKTKENYIKRKNSLIKKLFTKNVKSFACMQAVSDDMINVGELITKLKIDLNIENLTKQEENIGSNVNKNIIYGYIPLWPANLVIVEKDMNMQAALTNNRSSGSKLVIGTPILLHEY